MARWIRIAATADCPAGTALECLVEGQVVALYNIEGVFRAMDGICPHQGGPLAKGHMDSDSVTCPWHGWTFDLATGEHRSARTIVQRCFAVRVEGGEVFIELEGGH